MTIADYDGIRGHLAKPRTERWDPVKGRFASERPTDGPADWSSVNAELERLSQHSSARLSLIAALAVTRDIEAEAVVLARRFAESWWRSGPTSRFQTMGIVGNCRNYADNPQTDLLESSAAHALAGAIDATWRTDSTASTDAVISAAFAATPLVVNEREASVEFRRFLADWWARCRALLPIADVTTAEIEWAGIELPPRPIDGDLPPGDIPTWITHNDEDAPGPVGEPIPPDQWTMYEVAKMVAVEIENRKQAGVGCWLLLAGRLIRGECLRDDPAG